VPTLPLAEQKPVHTDTDIATEGGKQQRLAVFNIHLRQAEQRQQAVADATRTTPHHIDGFTVTMNHFCFLPVGV
jgi:hypothetical protein